MAEQRQKSYGTSYGLVILAWLAYAAISLTAPSATTVTAYHINGLQLNLIKLTIIIPVLIIWLIATYGAAHFKRYADLIAGEPDGKALRLISLGLRALVLYLISSTLLSAILPFFISSSWLKPLIVLKSHLPLVLALATFTFIYQGSLRLLKIVNLKTWTNRRSVFLLLPFCLFAAFFTWIFFRDPNLQTVTNNRLLPPFAISSNILVFSYVIPYLITWFLGCMAALNISLYAKNVHGSIYRSTLINLVTGVTAVVVFTIILQFFTAASSIWIQFNLQALLLVIYALIILDAAGYIFIALGARQLAKIEEVK